MPTKTKDKPAKPGAKQKAESAAAPSKKALAAELPAAREVAKGAKKPAKSAAVAKPKKPSKADKPQAASAKAVPKAAGGKAATKSASKPPQKQTVKAETKPVEKAKPAAKTLKRSTQAPKRIETNPVAPPAAEASRPAKKSASKPAAKPAKQAAATSEKPAKPEAKAPQAAVKASVAAKPAPEAKPAAAPEAVNAKAKPAVEAAEAAPAPAHAHQPVRPAATKAVHAAQAPARKPLAAPKPLVQPAPADEVGDLQAVPAFKGSAPGDAPLVLVGAVTGAFGVKGEVRVRAFTAEKQGVIAYGPLHDVDGEIVLRPKSFRTLKDGVAITTPEVKTREEAEKLKGLRVYVPRANLPAPAEDEFYIVDLLGCSAESVDGAVLGEIVGVWNFGAGDILEYRPRGGGPKVQVAFTKDTVPLVDLSGKRVVLDPPAPEPEPSN